MHKSLGPHANDDLIQMYQVYQVVVGICICIRSSLAYGPSLSCPHANFS
jgi:hypothetical protein